VYDYEEYLTDDIMVPVSIYEKLTTEEHSQIKEPNLIQVQSLRSRIANILYHETSALEETGHTSIMESLEGHRLRVSDLIAKLPKPPTRPIAPTDTTGKLFPRFKWDLGHYNTYKH